MQQSNGQAWSDEAAAHEEGPHFFWSHGYCNSPVVGEVVEEDAVDLGEDDDQGDVGDDGTHVGRLALGGGGGMIAVGGSSPDRILRWCTGVPVTCPRPMRGEGDDIDPPGGGPRKVRIRRLYGRRGGH